jgi:hypothetical protein
LAKYAHCQHIAGEGPSSSRQQRGRTIATSRCVLPRIKEDLDLHACTNPRRWAVSSSFWPSAVPSTVSWPSAAAAEAAAAEPKKHSSVPTEQLIGQHNATRQQQLQPHIQPLQPLQPSAATTAAVAVAAFVPIPTSAPAPSSPIKQAMNPMQPLSCSSAGCTAQITSVQNTYSEDPLVAFQCATCDGGPVSVNVCICVSVCLCVCVSVCLCVGGSVCPGVWVRASNHLVQHVRQPQTRNRSALGVGRCA